MNKPLLLLALTIFFTSFTQARTWVNTKGQKIEADYISATSTHVAFKVKGKTISYPLDKLSEEDRQWVKARIESDKTKTAEKLKDLLGFRKDVPITGKLFPKDTDYFKETTRKSCARAYEAGAYSNKGKLKDWIKRNPGNDRCIIYCPPSYDGTQAYGLYLHINHSEKGHLRKEWFPLFDRLKLIAVSANDVGNYETGKLKQVINPHLHRVFYSMNALATVREQYKIDPERCIVGGTSGGGHMAFLTAALFPEFFKGALSSAAQSYMPDHFPGLAIKDFKRKNRKKLKWVVISGNKDKNYSAILETSKVWEKNRLNYRFIDIPGMGHQDYAPAPFEEALKWIGIVAPDA